MTNDLNSSTSTTIKQKKLNEKPRKFRWSSCFSFVTNKLGKKSNKSSSNQQIRLSQSYENFDNNNKHVVTLSESIDVTKARPSSSMVIWNHQHLQPQQPLPTPLLPPPSLSPPPRQTKCKRESYSSNNASTPTALSTIATKTTNRRPLIDPTLTPRVKPISIKTKKQPSLLRLSLDAELLQSPDGDNDSFITFKTGRSASSASITPTATANSVPFRSGTLGATNNPRLNTNAMQPPPPPLPPLNIPLDSTTNSSRPHSRMATIDSPISISSDDDEQKLTLIERRRRRSPLSMPNTDQMTLALQEMLIEEQQQQQPQTQTQAQSQDDLTWRQQLLEQTIAYSLNDQPRQDAMLALEGKKVRTISLQPIAHIRELDHHFEQRTDNDLVRDKAEYEAIVARTAATHRRQLSYEEKRQSRTSSLRARSPPVTITDMETKHQEQQQQQLEIITENEVATCRTPTSASNKFHATNNKVLSATPETPPYHKQTAPSLISAPSTPNSVDSSVIEQDDYINHQKHQMSVFLSASN